MSDKTIKAGMSVPPSGGSASGFNDPGGAMGDTLQVPPTSFGNAGAFNGTSGCLMGNELSNSDAADKGVSGNFSDL